MKTVHEYLEIIGWSMLKLSQALDCNERTIRRWGNGQNQTPPEVLKWLDHLARAHEKCPAPEGWRTKSALRMEE